MSSGFRRTVVALGVAAVVASTPLAAASASAEVQQGGQDVGVAATQTNGYVILNGTGSTLRRVGDPTQKNYDGSRCTSSSFNVDCYSFGFDTRPPDVIAAHEDDTSTRAGVGRFEIPVWMYYGRSNDHTEVTYRLADGSSVVFTAAVVDLWGWGVLDPGTRVVKEDKSECKPSSDVWQCVPHKAWRVGVPTTFVIWKRGTPAPIVPVP